MLLPNKDLCLSDNNNVKHNDNKTQEKIHLHKKGKEQFLYFQTIITMTHCGLSLII